MSTKWEEEIENALSDREIGRREGWVMAREAAAERVDRAARLYGESAAEMQTRVAKLIRALTYPGA